MARLTLTIHILAGTIALLTGFAALAATKGATLHRRSGTVFLYAMVVMGLMGSLVAILQGVARGINVPMGVLAAYLVVTGVTTVHPRAAARRWLDTALLLVAIAVTAALIGAALTAIASPRGRLHGIPAPVFLIFGSIALLASVGDVRLLRAGGAHTLRGAPRLTRHLWRMSVALLIAAFSFFLGQAKVIPEPIRIIPLLIVPPLAVLASLLYWVWRIRVRRALRGLVTADAVA